MDLEGQTAIMIPWVTLYIYIIWWLVGSIVDYIYVGHVLQYECYIFVCVKSMIIIIKISFST